MVGHWSTYEEGLRRIAVAARDGGGTMLVLLLGSNIGNFDPPAAAAFLAAIRDALAPGDLLLLGADLVKPGARPAARLRRSARRDRGVQQEPARAHQPRARRRDFDLAAPPPPPIWNAEQRIEMHLVSRRDQTVTHRRVGTVVPFRRDERIWTESSYKIRARRDRRDGRPSAGFATRDQWIDDARFALTLLVAI